MATNKRLRRDYDAAKTRMEVLPVRDNIDVGVVLMKLLCPPTDESIEDGISSIVAKGLVMEGKANEDLQESVRGLVTTTIQPDGEGGGLNELQGSTIDLIATTMDEDFVEGGRRPNNNLQLATLRTVHRGMSLRGSQTRSLQSSVMELSRHAIGKTPEGKEIIRSIIKEEETKETTTTTTTVSKDDYDELKNDFESFKKSVFIVSFAVIAMLLWLSLRLDLFLAENNACTNNVFKEEEEE